MARIRFAITCFVLVAPWILAISLARAVPVLDDNLVTYPTASTSGEMFVPVGSSNVKTFDQAGANLYGDNYPQMVFTVNFTTGTNFPPTDAVIQEVYISAVVRNSWVNYKYHYPEARTCVLGWAVGNSFPTVFPSMMNYSTSFVISGAYWREINWRITEEYDWTANILTGNNTPSLWLALGTQEAGSQYEMLIVDYLGLRYNYTLSGAGPPHGPPSDFTGLGAVSISGLFGLFGLIWMIAIPAISVWIYRRDGGSKIAAALMALIAFVFCGALFLSSMGI